MDFVGFRSEEGGSGWSLASSESLGGSSDQPTFFRAVADEVREDSGGDSAEESGVMVEAGALERLDSP
jgi:hypothetical protein